MFSITFVSPDPEAAQSAYHTAGRLLNAEGVQLGPNAWDLFVERPPDPDAVAASLDGRPVDVCRAARGCWSPTWIRRSSMSSASTSWPTSRA
jgi:hypothetical protein